jgi:DNA-binding PadR family transcriptional regulator
VRVPYARYRLLEHLARLSKAGPIYAKTTVGAAKEVKTSPQTAWNVLRSLEKEGLVTASKPMIIGKNPIRFGRRRPRVYEITDKGIQALDELRRAKQC